ISLTGLLYVAAIFLRFFLPFLGVGYMKKWFRFIFTITEPLLKPLRRIFVAGMFDFSPLVAMVLVQLLTGLLANAIGR
ncbi:MAG TPA: YggT family protein, partial [Blastocatellia bacterium]|nr:YggT family protein [Blastocatellia bacterium]